MISIKKMKKFVLAMMLLCAAVAGKAEEPVHEQDLSKGQVHISRVDLFSQEGKVHLSMRVAYSSDLLNRGEQLYVSPRLRSGSQMVTFSSMVFDGKSRKVRVRDSNAIVVMNENYGQFLFDIEFISTYEEWMQDVSLSFLSEEVMSGNLRQTYEDILQEGMLVVVK